MANGIQGLLGSGSLTDLGLGLLSASGPVVGRPAPSLGQALGQASVFASNRGAQRLENEIAREKLRQVQRRREAANQLQGLLSSQTTIQGPGESVAGMGGESLGAIPGMKARVPEIATSGGQNQLLGLLGQIAPEQVASSLLSQRQERAEPSQVRIARTLADPNESEEVKENIRRQIEADSSVNEQTKMALDIQAKQLEIQKELNELREQKKSQEQSRGDLVVSLRQDLNDAKKLAEINNRLKDTVLETGVPFPELRRSAASGIDAVKRVFGADDRKAQQIIADYDEFKKLSTRFATQSATRLFDSGNITNFQLQSIQDATPSLSISAEANDRILADQLEMILTGAERADVDIKDRDEFEELVGRLRNPEPVPQDSGPSTPTQRGTRPARDVEELSDQELKRSLGL